MTWRKELKGKRILAKHYMGSTIHEFHVLELTSDGRYAKVKDVLLGEIQWVDTLDYDILEVFEGDEDGYN